jgi:uncharacterized membrane protein
VSTLGGVHLVFSFVAIGAGAIVVLMPKGTRWHRTLGHVYVMSMIGVVVTALGIYDLTGRFGPFHFAALIGGLTLAAGMYTVLWRRPRGNWIESHATWMSWSYVGVMAAFFAESLSRFVMPRVAPFLDGTALWGVFWTAVGVATFGVTAIGWWLVKTRLPRAVATTPAAIRRERDNLSSVDNEGLTMEG